MRSGFRIPCALAALLVLGPGSSDATTEERQAEQPRIFPIPVLVSADILMLACEPHRATIRTTGSVELPGLDLSPGGPTALAGGLHIRFIFWSVENPHDASGHLIQPASIDAKLLEAGAAFRIPKQPVAPSARRSEQILALLPGGEPAQDIPAETADIGAMRPSAHVPST